MPALYELSAIAALLFATTAWGSLFIVGKPVLAVIDPVWFTALRYALSMLMLAGLVARFGRAPAAKLRAHGLRLTLLGLAGYGWFSILVLAGLARSPASHGSVIMATMPMSTLALRWWLDGARPSGRALIGAAIALAGVATVAGVFGGGPAVDARMLLGDALTLAGSLGWVLYTRGAASLPGFSPLEYTALTAAASAPWLLAGAGAASALGLMPAPSPAALLGLTPTLLFVAAVPTVLAAFAFNFGVRRVGAPIGTLFLTTVPVSVLVMRAILGSPPRATELAGAAMVGLALWLNASSRQNTVRAAPANRCPVLHASGETR